MRNPAEVEAGGDNLQMAHLKVTAAGPAKVEDDVALSRLTAKRAHTTFTTPMLTNAGGAVEADQLLVFSSGPKRRCQSE